MKPPSPNEGKILRALQEETRSMMSLIGKPMGGGHRVPPWEGYFDLEEIAEEIKRRPWCRGRHWQAADYVWSVSTIRMHMERLLAKGWVQKRKCDNTRRSLYRVHPDHRDPFYQSEHIPTSLA